MTANSGPDLTTPSVPVAIVGAGPVGLSLALGLARQGIRSVVVEQNETTSERSKAPAIHVRTREILRQWGVEGRFLDEGVLRTRLDLHDVARSPARHRLLSIDFSVLEDEAARPGLLILEQGRTESLLLDAVRQSGMCEVRFGTEAVSLRQGRDRVTLGLRSKGRDCSVQASFVVGCCRLDSRAARPPCGLGAAPRQWN